MRYGVNISIDDVSPHPKSSTKVLDRCFELIEQFPELPPLQEAKKQLLESTQFTQYKQKLGYEDDKVALRQMVKDARAMDKEKRKTPRRAIKENQDLGLTPK